MINLIGLILIIYVIGIIVFIIHLSKSLQKLFFEEEGVLLPLSNIIIDIIFNPEPILLLSWLGLLYNENKYLDK